MFSKLFLHEQKLWRKFCWAANLSRKSFFRCNTQHWYEGDRPDGFWITPSLNFLTVLLNKRSRFHPASCTVFYLSLLWPDLSTLSLGANLALKNHRNALWTFISNFSQIHWKLMKKKIFELIKVSNALKVSGLLFLACCALHDQKRAIIDGCRKRHFLSS